LRERRRKSLSRRHIQRDEIFRHVQSSRSFQKRRKKALCNVSCDLVADIWEQRWKAIRQNINTKTRIMSRTAVGRMELLPSDAYD
jgi:hypothetical protein